MPRMRSEANALRKALQVLERRHEEAVKSCHAAAGRYERECSQLHLLGENLQAELQAAVLQLPEKLQSSVQALQNSKLNEVCQTYAQQAGDCVDNKCQVLPALKAVLSNTCQPASVPKLQHMWVPQDDKHIESQNDVAIHNLSISEAELEVSPPVATHDRSEVNTWAIEAVQEGDSNTPVISTDTNTVCIDGMGQQVFDGATGQQPCPKEAAAASRVAFNDDFRAQLMADLYEMQAFCSRTVEEAETPEPIAAVFGTLLQKGDATVAVEDARDAMTAISMMFDTLQGRADVQMALQALTSTVFAERLLRQLTISKNQVWHTLRYCIAWVYGLMHTSGTRSRINSIRSTVSASAHVGSLLVQERKYKEAGEEVLLRQQEEQRKLANILSKQNQCMQYVEWLSKQVEQQLADKVGRQIVLPPELLC